MCNLSSITTNQAAIIALFRVINRHVGNLPPNPSCTGSTAFFCLNRKGRPQYAERPSGLKIDANEKRPLPRTTYRRAIGQPAGDGIPRCDTETFMTLLFDYTRVLFVDEEEGPAR